MEGSKDIVYRPGGLEELILGGYFYQQMGNIRGKENATTITKQELTISRAELQVTYMAWWYLAECFKTFSRCVCVPVFLPLLCVLSLHYHGELSHFLIVLQET